MNTRTTLSIVLLSGWLGACALQSDVPPLAPTDVPASYSMASGSMATGSPAVEWPAPDWWQNFGDAELSTLISQVQASNLDLASSQRNLQVAQLTLRDAGFNLLPRANLSVGAGIEYQESRINGQQSDSNASPFDAVASLSYTDILSKPAVYTQAVANYESRAAQVADIALTTLGTSASTYFQLLLTRDKLTAAEQNVLNAEAISNIVNARVDAGVAVPLEALQQQIALQRERANLRSLQQNELAARSSLALLTAQNVQELNLAGETLETMVVPQVAAGLPSELLLRRPDLVQAEADMRSVVAGFDIARSDYFPDISLTASLNASSSSLSDLVSSPDLFLTSSAALLQSVLDTGQRSRNVERSRLIMESGLATYRRTVLAAFNEIEVLLSATQLQAELVAVALQNLQAAEEAFRIAQVRYEEGVLDFQTVLTSQNTLFDSRNTYLDNKLQQLNTAVSLYQALGGGWDAADIPR